MRLWDLELMLHDTVPRDNTASDGHALATRKDWRPSNCKEKEGSTYDMPRFK